MEPLPPELTRCLYGAHDGRIILIRAEVVAIDHGGILKVVAGQSDEPLLVGCTSAGAIVNASGGGVPKREATSGVSAAS